MKIAIILQKSGNDKSVSHLHYSGVFLAEINILWHQKPYLNK